MEIKREMKKKLLASSPTREDLAKMIDKYFFGCDFLKLHDNGAIENGKGLLNNYLWEEKKGRFRFLLLRDS